MKNKQVFRWVRWFGLLIILVNITYTLMIHQTKGSAKAPSVHALCPFGGLESLFSYFSTGTLIPKILTSTFLILIVTIVISILFRRSFCGILCPFGALQEVFAKIGQAVFKKRLIIPAIIDKPLRYAKYVVFIITIGGAWATRTLWWVNYDPYSTAAHIFRGLPALWAGLAFGSIILLIMMLGSFLYDRFFCKYFCPLGVFIAIIGYFSPSRVVRDDSVCIHCNLCSKVCPVNIPVASEKEVLTPECISCHECIDVCPKEGAIGFFIGRKPVSILLTWVLVMVLFFVPIFLFR